jgi:hypothetical protein
MTVDEVADTILHTHEDEEQGDIGPMLKKNIIVNSNIQQVVKNFEKSKVENKIIDDWSHQKQRVNLQKIVEHQENAGKPLHEQVLIQEQPKSRAGFKQRSKSVNIKEHTENNNLINQSDNIRNQLRKKYRIVSKATQNALPLKKRSQSRNQDFEQQKAQRSAPVPAFKKRTRNSTSYDTTKIKPVLPAIDKDGNNK